MPSNNKINKKLIKDVVTFLNKFICYDNVTASYTSYGTNYISVDISIWNFRHGYIDKYIAGINGCMAKYITGVNRLIYTKSDFDAFKQEVLDKLSSLFIKC